MINSLSFFQPFSTRAAIVPQTTTAPVVGAFHDSVFVLVRGGSCHDSRREEPTLAPAVTVPLSILTMALSLTVILNASSLPLSSVSLWLGAVFTGISLLSDQVLSETLARLEGSRNAASRELNVDKRNLVRRILEAAANSPLAKFRTLKGIVKGRPRHSDEILAGVLQRHGGSRTAASQELGLSKGSIIRRIRRASGNSPLAIFKLVKGEGGSKSLISDQAIADALRRHGGNRVLAGRDLGIGKSAVIVRVQGADPDSVLAPFKLANAEAGVSADELARVLEACGGSIAEAALRLEISSTAIDNRLLRASEDSPLAPFKRATATADTLGRDGDHISDSRMALVLSRRNGNRAATARELGLSDRSVGDRIARCSEDSPLFRFKRPPLREPVNRRFSDAQFAAALMNHGGSRNAAARELGCDKSLIIRRIQDADSESPLFVFKDLKGDGGGESQFSDDHVADVLQRHQGNRRAAARELGYAHHSSVTRRIQTATLGSPLLRFQNKT